MSRSYSQKAISESPVGIEPMTSQLECSTTTQLWETCAVSEVN